MDLHAIPRLNRLKTIILTLIKYGFDDLVARLELPGKLLKMVAGAKAGEYTSESTWKRLRYVLEELGPTFVKLGQVLSLRTDLIPNELAEELKGLQKEVPPEDFQALKEFIEDELEAPINEIFVEFDEVPIAAASLAQVHRARLKPEFEGSVVAVKVQRPGIESIIRYDLELLRLMAEEIHKHAEDLQVYNLPEVVRELSDMMRRELDFTSEARNMRAARYNMRHEEDLYLPVVFPEISTARVLIMELVEGRPLEDIGSLSDSERLKFARTGIRTALTQILEDGLFHADPHPGNIMILPDGRMSLLDWGMVGRLTPDMRLKLLALMLGLIDRDSAVVLDILLAISDVRLDTQHERVHRDIIGVLDNYYALPAEQQSIGGLLYQVTEVFRVYGVPIQPDLAGMVRALLTSEASARIMYPDLDIIKEAEPYIKRIILRIYSPNALARRFRSRLLRILHTRRYSLDMIYSILDKLDRDQLALQLEHRGLDHMEHSFRRVVNRLSLSLLTASIIIGSSMIITTGVKPLLFGFPLIGIAGYLISAFFAAWIILNIIRSRDI
ncbi:MAG: ABC1 kinase family protein [Spirochaetota bacterium]